jgi:hypothetical protein
LFKQTRRIPNRNSKTTANEIIERGLIRII